MAPKPPIPSLTPHVCLNCGFWQRHFATPPDCPVCTDLRHPLPAEGWRFSTAEEIDRRVSVAWETAAPDLVRFTATPKIGIGASGYLLLRPGGNVAFEGTAWYDDAALAHIETLGGIRHLSASHPHVYGALWRLQERFDPEIIIQKDDLRWTKSVRVAWPFDDRAEIAPGLELLHTGGHTEGHTVLYDRTNRALFCGDALKFEMADAGVARAIFCQKAFEQHVPLSHGEVRRYREVMEPLDFDAVFTPWEQVDAGGKEAALDLFAAQLEGRPFADPMPIAPKRRDRPLHPALDAYKRTIGLPDSEVYEIHLDPLDRLGVSIATVCAWDKESFCGGIGYGATRESSLLSAWGEMMESVMPVRALKGMERREGSYRDLRARGLPAVDPLRLCLPVGTAYTPDRPLQWVEGRGYPSGEPVWLPIEFVSQGSEDIALRDPLITPITNGMGAGDTLERAIAHGLMELLQRDGNSVRYRALDRGIGIDLDAVADPDTRRLLDHYDRQGVEVTAKLAATDFGLANLYVVGRDREPGRAPHPLSLSACGEAAHPDREVALGKALREFASSRCRKAFTHGPLASVEHLFPGDYIERVRATFTGVGERRAFEAVRDWCGLDHEALLRRVADPTLTVRSRIRFSSLPTVPPGHLSSPAAVLACLVDRLAEDGHDIVYVEFTDANSPARAVHVVVPGLEVETMTYGRVGPRNLRRLMEDGADFAGFGRPPQGALRVPMTREDEERLGGPAWFDPAGADEALAGLYALYREPGRHAIAFAAEGLGR